MAKRVVIELEVDPGTGLATIKNFGNTFDTEMKKVERSTKSAASSLQLLKFDAIIRFAERAFGYTQQIWNFGKAVTSMASDIERTSKVLGISTDEYQKWTYAAKQADAPIEALHGGMRILAKNLEDAARGTGEAREYLQALGITTRNLPQAILQIADAFSKTEDGAEKMAWAGKLLGERYGIQLVPLLNQGKAGIQGLGEEAKKLGIVVSEDVIKKGADAEKTFKDMDEKIKALKLTLAPLAGEFAKMIDSMVTNIQRLNSYIYELGENFEAWLKRSMVSNFGMKPSTVPFIEPPSGFYPPLTKGKGGLPSIAGKGVIAKAEDWESMGAVHLGKAIVAHRMKPESWLDALEEYQTNLKGVITLEEQRDRLIEDQIKQFNEINALNEQWIADEWEKEQGIDAVLKRINEVTFAEERLGEAAVLRHEFITEAWKKQRDALKEQVTLAQTLETAFTDVFDALVSGTLKGKDALKSFALAIIRDAMKPMIKDLAGAFQGVLKEVKDGISAFFQWSYQQVSSMSKGYYGNTRAPSAMVNTGGVGGTGTGGMVGSLLGNIGIAYSATQLFNSITGQKEKKATDISNWIGRKSVYGWSTAINTIIGYVYDTFFNKDDEKKEKERALRLIQRIKTYYSMQALGFEIPMTDKGKFDYPGIKEQGGLLGIPASHLGGKKRKELWAIAEELYKTVSETFADAMKAGLEVGSFKTFERSLRNSIYENILEGMVQAFTRTAELRYVLTPLYQYIYESVANALTKGFDIGLFKTGIEERLAKLTPVLAAMEPIFGVLSAATKDLRGTTTGGGRVTIPSFQQGGTMPWTGLAWVHKDEEIKKPGEGSGVTVNINNPVISNEQNINDLVRKIGRLIDWERRRSVAYG